MKITKVEAIPCTIPRKGGGAPSNVVLVKIHTDEGIIGAGDGGTCGQDAVMNSIQTLAPMMLIGEDPMDIGKIMNRLFRGMGGVNVTAVATIDFALYDIIGKALNQPVYQVLGGKAVEKLGISMMISNGTDKEMAEKATKAVEAGIHNIVVKVGPGWGNPSVFDDVAHLKAVRKAVGDEVYLGVDANGGMDYTSALDLALRLEEFGLFKIEQPVPRSDIDGLGRLQRKLHTPVWAHESAEDIPGLLECIKKDVCDGVCIKVVWSGGIWQSRKWAAIAEAADLAISCGSMMGSGYEAAAQAHFLAADPWMSKYPHANLGPPLLHGQWDTTNPQITNDLCLDPPVFKDGYFYAPDGPGLGLELNEKAIARLVTKGKKPISITEKIDFPFPH